MGGRIGSAFRGRFLRLVSESMDVQPDDAFAVLSAIRQRGLDLGAHQTDVLQRSIVERHKLAFGSARRPIGGVGSYRAAGRLETGGDRAGGSPSMGNGLRVVS